MIPVRTGNLGVWRLFAVLHGEAPPDPAEERALLPRWRSLGANEVEDYVAWALVEPERGHFDWSFCRDNARAAHKAGLRYVAYPWAHAIPAWFRGAEGYVPGRCLRHGQAGVLPSLFAESTWKVTHRFWDALREGLGDVVDGLAIAFPADYGEVGFPSGVADWLFRDDPPRSHQHAGLWCDEREARLAFAAEVRARYEEPARLAAAWGLLQRVAWEGCPYPWDLVPGFSSPAGDTLRDGGPDQEPTLAHRLDFARFYSGTVLRRLDALLAHVRRLFPRLPLEIKLGHCSEALELGTDWHALVALAARHGALVRFTGSAMGELFTRRVAALCRDHGARFGTEAPREIPAWTLLERAAHDAASGPVSFFEFPEQLEVARPALQAVAPVLGRAPRRPLVAALYPGTELALHPGHGAPEALAACWDLLRGVTDLDVLDERQVARGALGDPSAGGLAALVLLDGAPLPVDTLAALDAWLRAGGVLVASPSRAPVARGEDDQGLPVEGPGTGRPALDELLARCAPLGPADAFRARWRLATDGVELRPGEPEARAFLGPGWHGREEARWAFGEDAPDQPGAREDGALPARWTGPEAQVLLPCPAPARDDAGNDELQLVVEAFLTPGDAADEVVVACEGEVVARRSWCRAETLRVALPERVRARRGELLRVTLYAPAHVPRERGGSSDHRDLGLLVRRIALNAGAARETAGGREPRSGAGNLSEIAHRLPGADGALRVAAASLSHGRGRILRGDGSPLAAVAWLATWLAGEVADAPTPPDPPRDASRRAHVTDFDAGLLVFNPHRTQGVLAQLVGGDLPAAAREPLALAPLQALWLPRP